MGIHYDYKSKRGERAVLRQAKREARLARKKAKRKNVEEKQNSAPIEEITMDLEIGRAHV